MDGRAISARPSHAAPPTTDGAAPAPLSAPPIAPRRRHRPWRPILLLALLAVVAGGYWLLRPVDVPVGLRGSGTLEADEAAVAAEIGGRIVELLVDEGSPVRQGQVVARLDDAVLQVQLRQAGPAERQILEAQLERLTLRAPLAGTVQKRLLRRGEVAGAGAPIVTIANQDELHVTLYVPERGLGQVRPGQAVRLTADPFPGRRFGGQVQTIATRAEFTPRNVQTQRDRETLVFAVKVRVPNPTHELKAGLPVDATFAE